MIRTPDPKDWGLWTAPNGELMIGGFSAVSLAKKYGTPLHVLNEARLEATAYHFQQSMKASYPGKISVHYAFKCNSVPAVVQVIRRAGLKAEVMSEFELELASRLGFRGEEIIVNGPGKTISFLQKCLEKRVRFIVVDSLSELASLDKISKAENQEANVLLRINPDFIPRHMNKGTATGSRKGCAFGLDLKGSEVGSALSLLRKMKKIHFWGYHFHIGTGIRNPKDYSQALQCLAPLISQTNSEGLQIKVMDVGGGFASMTTRELTTREFLVYQGLERLPSGIKKDKSASFEDFAREITNSLLKYFEMNELPELIFEPGRSIASPNQFLLLTVHHLKSRPRLRKWLITDGGLGTVTLPTFYEYHEIFLANDVRRPPTEKVTIVGPVCFASDIVYRNKWMPRIYPGEVIAIMDSGAYFTALESSFGFPRPAIVAVNKATCQLIRRAESFEDMVCRDIIARPIQQKEKEYEICGY